jgi:hypothetical protein
MSEHNNILSHYKLASQNVLNKELSKLTPLKYNKFFWWRNYTNPNKPLGKHSSLVEKIHNGDYDISHYYWMAQQTIVEAKKKINENKDTRTIQKEKTMVDREKHRRLMADFEKDDNERLENMYKIFSSTFRLTKDELYNLMLNFDGTLEDFYYHMRSLATQNNNRIFK